MEITRTEIYDQPNSEGWWWAEDEPNPLILLYYENHDGKSMLLIHPGADSPGNFLGKWQKVQLPIWPSRKK